MAQWTNDGGDGTTILPDRPGEGVAHVRMKGMRCPCGCYHYNCDECGQDCTLGTPGGPAHTAIDRVTRCQPCHRNYEERVATLRNAAPALLAAAKKAETWLTSMARQLKGHISQNGPFDRDLNELRKSIEAAEGR